MINKNVARQIVDSEFSLKLRKALKEYNNELFSSKEFKDLVSKKVKKIKENENRIENLNKKLEEADLLIETLMPALETVILKASIKEGKEYILETSINKVVRDLKFNWDAGMIANDLYTKKITKEQLLEDLEKGILNDAEWSVKQNHYLIGWESHEIEENILLKLQSMITLSKEQSYENLIADINKRVDLKKEVADLYQLKLDLKNLK